MSNYQEKGGAKGRKRPLIDYVLSEGGGYLGGTWIFNSYFIYACVGYEVATIISYPTRVCGIMIVLLKMHSQGNFGG